LKLENIILNWYKNTKKADKLRAVKFYGKNRLKLENIPTPTVNDDEVLVKVKKVAITQLLAKEYFYGPYIMKNSIPIIPGHSFGGVVVKTGKNVEKSLIGKWVSVLPLRYCGKCYYCKSGLENLCENLKYYGLIGLDGGLSEYVSVKKGNIFLINKNDIDKITFIEPFLIGINILEESIAKIKTKFPNKNSFNILILGVGSIGLSLALVWSILRKEDNIFINDLFLSRLEILKNTFDKYKLYNNIHPIEKEYIKKDFFDIVIDTAGFEALALEPAILEGFKYTIRGGCLVSVGLYYNKIGFNHLEAVLKNVNIITTKFYRKKSIEKLNTILNDIKFNFSRFIHNISIAEVLENGFYKVQVDKEDFIRLEVKC